MTRRQNCRNAQKRDTVCFHAITCLEDFCGDLLDGHDVTVGALRVKGDVNPFPGLVHVLGYPARDHQRSEPGRFPAGFFGGGLVAQYVWVWIGFDGFDG